MCPKMKPYGRPIDSADTSLALQGLVTCTATSPQTNGRAEPGTQCKFFAVSARSFARLTTRCPFFAIFPAHAHTGSPGP